MPELVTIPNVTLVETGTWQASTGEVTFTSGDLYAAVAALSDSAVKTPRMRFGHTKPGEGMAASSGGFEEQPCVGKFTNLRVENEGTALIGDLVGVPAWLAAILPVAYPNRSVEAFFGVTTSTGKKHGMVITSVALLGESLPAVSTLDDLELIFSDSGSPEWIDALTAQTKVAASRATEPGGDPMPQRVAASVDMSDVRSAFYEQIATEESGRYYWWLHQIYLDPQVVIAEDDDNEFWLVPYSAKTAEFGEPTQVFIQWVEKESGKVAASSVKIPEQFGTPSMVYASAAASRPAGRQSQVNNMKEAKGSMPIDTSLLTQRLGLAADATEEQINEALAAETPTPAPPATDVGSEPVPAENADEVTTEPIQTPATTEPVAVAASGVTVDAETWARIQHDAAEGRKARDEQVKHDRQSFVAAAVKDGKIPPSRKAHYLSLMDKDDTGTREFLNNLAANSVPVDEIGTAEDSADASAKVAQGTGLIPGLYEEANA